MQPHSLGVNGGVELEQAGAAVGHGQIVDLATRAFGEDVDAVFAGLADGHRVRTTSPQTHGGQQGDRPRVLSGGDGHHGMGRSIGEGGDDGRPGAVLATVRVTPLIAPIHELRVRLDGRITPATVAGGEGPAFGGAEQGDLSAGARLSRQHGHAADLVRLEACPADYGTRTASAARPTGPGR
ncbi:MAG: hypothetical protein JRI68_13155 [Deltaproteobacteria bacterium]|nr:hypothetical protein [Deltaproteobacteria bacterium]